MTSNPTFACRTRPALCTKVFLNNLFTARCIVFLIFVLSSLTVQHVAEQMPPNQNQNNNFKKKSNLLPSPLDQHYSTRTASDKDRLIPESHFSDIKRNPLIVHTNNGLVLGKRTRVLIKPSSNRAEEHDVDAFLGLPYGRAPVAGLRFQKPLPLEKPWNGIFNATTPADSCIQLNDSFFGEFRGSSMWNANSPLSEDCLTVNLWVPSNRPPNRLLPVLVWIYGGAYYSGSISLDLYDGGILAAKGDVVLISINYRVASFGFLYLDREDAPGNMGFIDQILAVRWIKNNARAFGGDPDSITLFGESAGAATISFMITSPQVEEGLFHRAILQSGAMTSPWTLASHDVAIYRSLRLAENLGCIKATLKYELNEQKQLVEVQDMRRYKDYEYRTDPKLVKCMQEVDALQLINSEPNNTRVIEFPFVPVVDGHIIPEDPFTMLQKHNFKHIPVLLGGNTNEAVYFLVYQLTELLKLNETMHVSRMKLEEVIRKHFEEDDLILDAIVFKYLHWPDPEDIEKNLQIVDNVFGDPKFFCPMNDFARRYAEINSTIYQYYFNQRSTYNAWPKWMGVMHGDEINFIFGEPLRYGYDKFYSPDEVLLSERMIAFWTNFARTSDPLKSGTDLPQLSNAIRDDKWLPFTADRNTFKFLDTNVKDSVAFGPPRPDYCEFWNSYLPKFRAKIKERKLCNSAATNFNLRLALLLSSLTCLIRHLLHRSEF